MKRFLVLLIALSIVMSPSVVFAKVSETLETENGQKVDDGIPVSADSVPAPKWEDYVPVKYQNPRTDFNRGNAIAELSVGIVLTDLIITCPIGIPMICHATTKMKNLGYAEKKVKFNKGLEEAKTITDPQEREQYYSNLIASCKLKDRSAKNNAKKYKKAIKEESKKAREAEKQAKKALKDSKKNK